MLHPKALAMPDVSSSRAHNLAPIEWQRAEA